MSNLRQLNQDCPKYGAAPNEDCRHSNSKRNTIKAIIDSQRTSAGGWTKETLAQWDISWPPPQGWRMRLIDDEFNWTKIIQKNREAKTGRKAFKQD